MRIWLVTLIRWSTQVTASRTAGALGLMLLIVACDRTDEVATPAADPAELTEVEMVALMEGHYGSAIAAHDALIRGDLATLRSRLAEIEDHSLPPAAPALWRPFDERFQQAVRRASGADTLATGGDAMGGVVEACGACHVAVELGEIYRRPEPPQGETEIETAMLKHQWATERLWEGVTGPWDEAWLRGADALAESRVFGDPDREAPTEGLLAREEAMREVGRTARTSANLHDRAVIYGQLLSTCAACHREAGVVFRAPQP